MRSPPREGVHANLIAVDNSSDEDGGAGGGGGSRQLPLEKSASIDADFCRGSIRARPHYCRFALQRIQFGYTRFTNIFGTSIAKATMQPNPRFHPAHLARDEAEAGWGGSVGRDRRRGPAVPAAAAAAGRAGRVISSWLYPIVTSQYSSTTLHHIYYHIQQTYAVAVFRKWQSDLSPRAGLQRLRLLHRPGALVLLQGAGRGRRGPPERLGRERQRPGRA